MAEESSNTRTEGGATSAAPGGPTGALSGDEPRCVRRVTVWSKSATQTPIRE